MARTAVKVDPQPLSIPERMRRIDEDNGLAVYQRVYVDALAGAAPQQKMVLERIDPVTKKSEHTTTSLAFGEAELKAAMESANSQRIDKARVITVEAEEV